MNSKLLDQIETYVISMLSGTHEKAWPFHNIRHVKLVVVKCIELAQAHNLSQRLTDELIIAAWFHDIGYIDGSADHETRSSKMCLAFLNMHKVDPDMQYHISNLILITRYPAHPVSIQEKILCDADLYHLASDTYSYWADRLFQEVNQHQSEPISKHEWLEQNVAFFQNHTYYTDYALRDWTPQKLKNLLALKHQIELAERDPHQQS